MARLNHKTGKTESQAHRIAEKQELIELLVKVFSRSFEHISRILSQKLGKGGTKKAISIFEETKQRFPVLDFINITNDQNLDFVNFVEMVNKLPAESQIHQVSNGLAGLIESELNLVKNVLGEKIYEEVFVSIYVDIKPILTDYKNFFEKYGVFGDIKRVFEKK